MKNPVTKLNKNTVQLSNGISFTIINDFKNLDGPVDSFDAALNNWLARTDDYSAKSFVMYVKSKNPNMIFIEEKEYNKITKGKVEHATEEDFLAENN